MEKDYNSQSFTPEEVAKGLHLELLKTLMSLSSKSDRHYNDIHITTDGYCTMVEWSSVPYSHEYGGTFQFVDEDHSVMYQGQFPDNHYEYYFSKKDYEEELKDWLKKHPDWVKTEYGTWTDMEENRYYFLDRYNENTFREHLDTHNFVVVYYNSEDSEEILPEVIDKFNHKQNFVIQRADFILIGNRDVAKAFIDGNTYDKYNEYNSYECTLNNKEEIDYKEFKKIGYATVLYPSQFDGLKIKKLPIYYSPYIGDDILFYTNTRYLIGDATYLVGDASED